MLSCSDSVVEQLMHKLAGHQLTVERGFLRLSLSANDNLNLFGSLVLLFLVFIKIVSIFK